MTNRTTVYRTFLLQRPAEYFANSVHYVVWQSGNSEHEGDTGNTFNHA